MMCANVEAIGQDLKSVGSVQYDGAQQTNDARASETGSVNVTGSGDEIVVKKRKTRRGKPKRRNPNPYVKPNWQQRKNLNAKQAQRRYRSKIIAHGQAFAPYNSNQFLMEDHGNLQELDDKLNKSDAAGSSLVPPRTRDSSFSVDSDADFYSSPEDEEEFLTKEFDNAYEDLHVERLQSMSKTDLIQEYLQLENKVEILTERLKGKSTNIVENDALQPSEDLYQVQLERLMRENEDLRQENEILRNGGCRSVTPLSSSVDSESDSSSSTCNSSSSTDQNDAKDAVSMSPPHETTNGHSPESNVV